MVEANFLLSTTNQKHYQNLDGDKSSVWNFCACLSDVILRGNPMVGSRNVGLFLRLWYEKMKVDKTFRGLGWEW